MNTRNLNVLILAGGKSVRFNSGLTKLLHKLAGVPVFEHILMTLKELKPKAIYGVYGESTKILTEEYPEIKWVLQPEAKGTGDAVRCAMEHINDTEGDLIITGGDTPLITSKTFQLLIDEYRKSESKMALLSTELSNPTGYGRVLTLGARVTRIVEEKDAPGDVKEIKLINSGIYVAEIDELKEDLTKLKAENAAGEYYLPDLVKIRKTIHVQINDSDQVRGINTRSELAKMARLLQKKIHCQLMIDGVTLIDPSTTHIEYGVVLGQDTIVNPTTMIKRNTICGKNCEIGPGTVIADSTLGDNVTVLMSHVAGVKIGNNVKVGPFANLRPDTVIEDDAKIGDFVEIKKSIIKAGSKVPHLSYIGDATVGSGVNIGCGTITCNYDGVTKHRTDIGDDVFIGSSTIIVAPRKIGAGSFTAAGSVITEDVPDNSLALGRARQVNKDGWAIKRREELKRQQSDK